MTSNTKIILGLFAAAAAGAAVGIMLAPEKGSELRRKIRETVEEWADDVSELLAVGQEEIKERVAQAREGLKTAADSATDHFNKMQGSN
jgi:gas vesicle protein